MGIMDFLLKPNSLELYFANTPQQAVGYLIPAAAGGYPGPPALSRRFGQMPRQY